MCDHEVCNVIQTNTKADIEVGEPLSTAATAAFPPREKDPLIRVVLCKESDGEPKRSGLPKEKLAIGAFWRHAGKETVTSLAFCLKRDCDLSTCLEDRCRTFLQMSGLPCAGTCTISLHLTEEGALCVVSPQWIDLDGPAFRRNYEIAFGKREKKNPGQAAAMRRFKECFGIPPPRLLYVYSLVTRRAKNLPLDPDLLQVLNGVKL